MPIASRPAPICQGVAAKLVAIAVRPMPMKKTHIMPSRLHLSASQPAGRAQTPKAKNPGVA